MSDKCPPFVRGGKSALFSSLAARFRSASVEDAQLNELEISEIKTMKKKAPIVFIIVSVFAVAAIIIISAYRSSESYRKAKATIQWDCSVSCTEKSTSAQYVITYSNVKVSSKTGTLTIQNRNDFEIVVHLLCEGEQEIVSGNIPAGSCYSFANVTDKEYTVGIHADVDAATNIKVIVYDGKDTEPYTN